MTSSNKRVFVAGHRGMVGSAIVRELHKQGYEHVVTRSRSQLDLTNQEQVRSFFAEQKFDEVYVAAAKVGGIHANNTYPADFLYQNLMIQSNLIHSAYLAEVDRLLFLGSSCVYPKMAPQPIREEALLTGPLEPTNEAYAVAKIAGIKMCESYAKQHGVKFFSAMPTNLYGQNDNYDLQNSHVLPALIRRLHEAKIRHDRVVPIWGSGTPRREFLYVDDLARACVKLMNHESADGLYNIGSGTDIAISDLAMLVAEVVGFNGRLIYDPSKPDGTPCKLMDSHRMNGLGWRPEVELREGIAMTYQHFLSRSTSPETEAA